ncbi:MAG: FKBP-type peptidyl-prolyl cis-trans isomerase [Dysgonamonadaceae bacterium]|jgi:FKBP-type peptidyl-prolyl cis-trans isomerase SlyD|nr:FKBP-type peptidyl-prolyl cis-trans isomerase [Dysgonamonadaceae bacterium]
MKISNNKMVSLIYDLNVGSIEEDELELMESVPETEPLKFIYGTGMMLDEFEKNIFGLSEGDTFAFTLPPEKAYGDRDEQREVELPKKAFMIDGKIDPELLVIGNLLPMVDSNGNKMLGAVSEVKDDLVLMDFNHPLAGETLHFKGRVLDVHEPTVEEIAAISGGCNCEGDCDCDCGYDCGTGACCNN